MTEVLIPGFTEAGTVSQKEFNEARLNQSTPDAVFIALQVQRSRLINEQMLGLSKKTEVFNTKMDLVNSVSSALRACSDEKNELPKYRSILPTVKTMIESGKNVQFIIDNIKGKGGSLSVAMSCVNIMRFCNDRAINNSSIATIEPSMIQSAIDEDDSDIRAKKMDKIVTILKNISDKLQNKSQENMTKFRTISQQYDNTTNAISEDYRKVNDIAKNILQNIK